MPTKSELAIESAELTAQVQALAIIWRERAYNVQAEIKGGMQGARWKRPSGTEKARMGVQVSVLLSCAASLETLL